MAIHRLMGLSLMLLLITSLNLSHAESSTQNPTESNRLGLAIGTGFEFETGQYGTDQTIDSWRIPFIIEWTPHARLGISLEIPYIYQSNTSEAIILGGLRMGTGRMAGASPMSTVSSTSASGLGDSTLNIDLRLLGDSMQTPKLLGLLYVKLPTADSDKGLGTGEFDFGGGLGLSKRVGSWSGYAEILHIVPGTSDSYAPSAYWEWLASLSHRTSTTLRPGLSISGGTTPFEGNDDPLEIKARLGILGSEHVSYSLSISHGLSDASPEWGGGLFVYIDF